MKFYFLEVMTTQTQLNDELVKENETNLDLEISLLIITENQSNWIVKNNFQEADFWLINKGSKSKLGQPVKQFETYLTGIKCPNYIFPNYGYYLCLHLFQQGIWQQYANGTTNLQHLRIRDIKSFFNSLIPATFIH